MARARLDSLWWKKNRPTALADGALEGAIEDFAKVNRTLEKSGDVAAYFKAVSRLKAAIAKDTKVLRKAKDKEGLKLLSELEKQAHDESQAKQKKLTFKSGLAMDGLSGSAAGVKVTEGQAGDAVQLVNGKDRGWTLIKNNQIVSSAKNKSCQCVPKGVRDLTDWKNEQASWTGVVRSQGNASPLSIQFKLQYQYGGRPADGGGVFLNDCRLWVSDLRVPWGYTIDGKIDVGKPYNSGSRSAPVGAIPIKLTLEVATSLDRTTKCFSIDCHGNKKREVK